MEKKQTFGLSSKILFVVVAISILDASTIKIMPPKMHSFVWYSLVCWVFYYSIWGNLAEHAWNSARNVRFPALTGGNRTLEDFTKIWKFFAILFFVICTIGFVVGLFSPIAK